MGDHTAQLWDAATGETIQVFQCENDVVKHAIISPDGKIVLTMAEEPNPSVRSFDAQTGEQIFSIPVSGLYLRFFPDGQSFFTGGNRYRSTDGILIQRNFTNGTVYTISPDWKIYIEGWSPTASIWSIGSRQLVLALEGHTEKVIIAAFSHNGDFVVTGACDNTARVWDTATGEQMMLLSGHTSCIWHLAISPDDTKVLTGTNGEVRLWDITGEANKAPSPPWSRSRLWHSHQMASSFWLVTTKGMPHFGICHQGNY